MFFFSTHFILGVQVKSEKRGKMNVKNLKRLSINMGFCDEDLPLAKRRRVETPLNTPIASGKVSEKNKKTTRKRRRALVKKAPKDESTPKRRFSLSV